MQGAVEQVYVVHVQLHPSTLEKVQEICLRLLRYLPHGAGLHGYVTRVLDILQDGNRIPGKLQYEGKLRQRPVELPRRLHQRRDVGDAPELLRLPEVGKYYERDESVGVLLPLQQNVIDPELEFPRRPDLDNGGFFPRSAALYPV